jgi:4-amino-4-deoxy-L-arabinose transferase-like glycosyltransferase
MNAPLVSPVPIPRDPRLEWTADRQVIGLLLIAQILFWTAVPALTHTAFPLDVVEGLVWGQEWQWGYYKHPPLQAWLLATVTALPGGDWVGPFLLSQLAIAATYFTVWRLAIDLLPRSQALAGVLLLTGVYYFSYPTPEFNPNVLQMPLWAFILLCLWRALQRDRLSWWAGLGIAAGLALLTKYAAGVLLAVILLYLFLTPEGRRQLPKPGPRLALGLCLLIVAPHLAWLVTSDFLPLHYALGRAGESPGWAIRLAEPLEFLGAQLLDHAGLIALLGIGGLLGRGRGKKSADGWQALPLPTRRFLLTFGLGPLALTVLLSLLLGLGLKDMWGTPMFSLSGLLAVALLRSRWPAFRAERFLIGVTGLLVLIPTLYGFLIAFGPALTGKPHRGNLPAETIAAQLETRWFQATGRPLALVIGDEWTAGNVALYAAGQPSVLINGNFRLAPWVKPEDLEDKGALLVWPASQNPPPTWALSLLPQVTEKGMEQFNWPVLPHLSPLSLAWAVLPPRAK